MNRRALLAYALIGLGVLALLARLTDGAGWIWIALVAGVLLAAYVQQRTYGFLALGGVLAGTAVGLLLQGAFPRCDGVFLIALGAGVFAIDRVEPREPRWARGVGLGLMALGLVLVLVVAGVLQSVSFAVLLIAVGAVLLWRRREAAAFPPPRVTPVAPPPREPMVPAEPAAVVPTEPPPPAAANGTPPSSTHDATEPGPTTG